MDYMISLKRYNNVLKIDKDAKRVKVQGGCLVKDLNELLPQHDLAFSVQGTVSDLTVAGVISTGTHGTGESYRIFSSYVMELELMTASGKIMELSKEKNGDIFLAACLSLGSLGVILSVTFECESAYNLHQHQFPAKLDDVLENLDTYVTASEHFRFFWFPHTDSVTCYHCTRTTKEKKSHSSWFWDMLIGYYLLEIIYWISTFFPRIVPAANRLFYNLLYSSRTERIDRCDHIFNFNCLFKQYVMEWCIPRNQTALVLFELRNWILRNDFPAHFPVEVRFVKGDNIYLNPAYGWDACYINIIMYRPFNKFVNNEAYWQAFQKIVASVGGRPHWAKDHTYGQEQFEKLYPQWEAFCKVREQLDPNGMFLNSNLERVFGKKRASPNGTQ